MTPRRSGLSTETLNQGRQTRVGTTYELKKRGKPENPLTKMTFKIPRQIHHKLLEIAHTKGTSQQELLAQALYEWLRVNGAPDLAPLLIAKPDEKADDNK
jgi:hypothetical protein